jgi:hypothetical protein
MPFDPKSKLAKVRQAMANGDWDLAIRTAAKFPSLGKHEKAILRGRDVLNNPVLYAQMKFNLEHVRNEAIAALKERYSHSWEAAAKAKKRKRKRPTS